MITSKERAFLKSKLNTMKPSMRIGKDGIRDLVRSRGLGDVYKRQEVMELFGELEEKLGVEFLAKLGSNLSIYRKSEKNKLLHEFEK